MGIIPVEMYATEAYTTKKQEAYAIKLDNIPGFTMKKHQTLLINKNQLLTPIYTFNWWKK